jgi:hypothetical protein
VLGRLRNTALIAFGFFLALLVMYRFDFGMTVAALAIGAVFVAIGFVVSHTPSV